MGRLEIVGILKGAALRERLRPRAQSGPWLTSAGRSTSCQKQREKGINILKHATNTWFLKHSNALLHPNICFESIIVPIIEAVSEVALSL